MNADFEAELAAPPGTYRRIPTIARRNRRLAPTLLWLACRGDALLVDEPWSDEERRDAERRGVALLSDSGGGRVFSPWGWTPSAISDGERVEAVVEPVPIDTVARVNSKVFSHEIEREMGIAVQGAALATTIEALEAAVARACPGAEDKWVVKAPLGFAARERVLGRGPRLDPPSAVWAARRFAFGETLLVEPWRDVVREYGVQIWIARDGAIDLLGISRMLTNGAGATVGYVLADPPPARRAEELQEVAREVGRRLYDAGYTGPAGVDALEHAGGLRPLLEINARYTMGHVALAAERGLALDGPTEWRP